MLFRSGTYFVADYWPVTNFGKDAQVFLMKRNKLIRIPYFGFTVDKLAVTT